MDRKFGDLHVHTKESDGVCTVEEVVEAAIAKKLKYICFTDHYPLPFELVEMDKRENRFSEQYIGEILAAKDKYAGSIEIGLGAEFDWFEELRDWTAEQIGKRQWDYVLGSIHWFFWQDKKQKIESKKKKNAGMPHPLPDGRWLPPDMSSICAVDETEEKFSEAAEICGGVEAFVCEYYRQLRLMIESRLFDGVGHFDLIKIWNRGEPFFSQNSSWYREAVCQTLDTLSRSPMCMEINANGWYKKIGEQYPGEWILREARARNIPITLSSDGHRKEAIGRDLDRAWDIAKRAGYEEWVRFSGRKRIPV